jgi:tetratricopeptide (TPR) repeat protein
MADTIGTIRCVVQSLILLVASAVCLFAQTKYDLFTEASRHYVESNYAEALEKYESILKLGYESGEIYFNMGNSYFKLGQIGKAILYYEKAARYFPGDEALGKNLDIARLQIVDKIEAIPRLRLSIWKDELLNLVSVNALAWSTLFIFILFSILIALYILTRKTVARRTAWIMAILFVVLLIIYTAKVYEIETKQYAIVMLPKIAVISEPSLSGTEVFVLHEGTKVRINRKLEDYAEITLADGKTGWIKLESLGMI